MTNPVAIGTGIRTPEQKFPPEEPGSFNRIRQEQRFLHGLMWSGVGDTPVILQKGFFF